MRGRTPDEARRSCSRRARAPEEAARLAPHKTLPGQPAVLDARSIAKLDPRTLGRLIALYEHKVFVEAAIWDINPFDQWGVELGKELASRLAPIVAEADADVSKLDASTAGLIAQHMRELRGCSLRAVAGGQSGAGWLASRQPTACVAPSAMPASRRRPAAQRLAHPRVIGVEPGDLIAVQQLRLDRGAGRSARSEIVSKPSISRSAPAIAALARRRRRFSMRMPNRPAA